jgi:hypothetical protein
MCESPDPSSLDNADVSSVICDPDVELVRAVGGGVGGFSSSFRDSRRGFIDLKCSGSVWAA